MPRGAKGSPEGPRAGCCGLGCGIRPPLRLGDIGGPMGVRCTPPGKELAWGGRTRGDTMLGWDNIYLGQRFNECWVMILPNYMKWLIMTVNEFSVTYLWVELSSKVLWDSYALWCRLKLLGIQHAVYLTGLAAGACGACPVRNNIEHLVHRAHSKGNAYTELYITVVVSIKTAIEFRFGWKHFLRGTHFTTQI